MLMGTGAARDLVNIIGRARAEKLRESRMPTHLDIHPADLDALTLGYGDRLEEGDLFMGMRIRLRLSVEQGAPQVK